MNPRPHTPTRRRTFARLVHAEFSKFRTVRVWTITLCAVPAAFVLLAWLSATASRASGPPIPSGPGGKAVRDTYTYLHQPLAGDGTITVRITALSGGHPAPPDGTSNGISATAPPTPGTPLQPGLTGWAKAGILLEPDTHQGTPYAAVLATGAHGTRMQTNYTADTPGLTGTVEPAHPRWLRLTRTGNTITGYDSTDGTHWTEIAATRLTSLPHTLQIGLFTTSPDLTTSTGTTTPSIATATFDDLTIHGQLPDDTWAGDEIGGPSPYTTVAWHQTATDGFTLTGSGDIAPLVGGAGVSHWAGASIVNGTIVALLIVIILAALVTTAEYRRDLINTTLTAAPRRGSALAAKAAVIGGLAFTTGAFATGISEILTRRVLAANGNYLFPQSDTVVARVVIGTGLLLGLTAVLVVAVGTLLRRGAATVATGTILVILPGVLATSLPGAADWLMRVTPTAAFAVQATLPRYPQVDSAYTISNGYFPISWWGSLAVLGTYTAIGLATARWLQRRRDLR